MTKHTPTIIAHRGASGYLPEHTLAAKSMAYAMNADYLEQDLVMTKDDHLVVLHDHYLDRVSNVAEVYPKRVRADGRFYVIDFTLAELRTLKLTESFDIIEGRVQQTYPNRFPLWKSYFQIHTFAEEIELIQGLNQSMGRQTGIYPEIKSPWFHQQEGKDISQAVLTELKKYGYTRKDDLVYLQCFDPNELIRIRTQLLPQMAMDLKLVQLIAQTNWNETFFKQDNRWLPYNYDAMLTLEGLKQVAQYADAIGPWYPMIVDPKSTKLNLKITDLVKHAHTLGLKVHPYTFRQDALPDYIESFEHLTTLFLFQIQVDRG